MEAHLLYGHERAQRVRAAVLPLALDPHGHVHDVLGALPGVVGAAERRELVLVRGRIPAAGHPLLASSVPDVLGVAFPVRARVRAEGATRGQRLAGSRLVNPARLRLGAVRLDERDVVAPAAQHERPGGCLRGLKTGRDGRHDEFHAE